MNLLRVRPPPPPQVTGKCEWAELTIYRYELAGHLDHPHSVSIARAVHVQTSQVAKEADAAEQAKITGFSRWCRFCPLEAEVADAVELA